MKLIHGKLDYSAAAMHASDRKSVFLFTGNAYLKANGALVMGRGAAKEVRDLYPGIDEHFGARIRAYKTGVEDTPSHPYKVYGVVYIKGPFAVRPRQELCPMRANGPVDERLTSIYQVPRTLGVFQVKYDFRDQADEELIKWSAYKLAEDARDARDHTFLVNFPGIGNGRLTREKIEPILSSYLPDNVHVYI